MTAPAHHLVCTTTSLGPVLAEDHQSVPSHISGVMFRNLLFHVSVTVFISAMFLTALPAFPFSFVLAEGKLKTWGHHDMSEVNI